MKKPVTKLVDINLSELSLVTRGANQFANISILKSDNPEIVEFVKYLSTDEGAKTFDAFMIEEAKQKQKNKVFEQIWPVMDALRNSIVSIRIDSSLSDNEKEEKIAESVAQFAAACQHPESNVTNVNEVFKLLTTYEDSMSEDIAKKAEELEAQVAELTKKLADSELLSKLSDDEKEYMSNLDKEEADKFKAADAATRKSMMKKSAEADEVFKSADGHEIRKSAVGESVFAILKSQDEALKATREEMVKAAERAQTVEFTKRAEEDFSHLPGETVAKVAVLKAMHGMDEAAQKTLTAMLKAGEEAIAKGYTSFGVSGGKPADLTKSAKRAELVKAHMDANPNVTKAQAEVAVLSAHPDLYEG